MRITIKVEKNKICRRVPEYGQKDVEIEKIRANLPPLS